MLHLLHLFHTFLFRNTTILITILNIPHAIINGTIEGLAGIRLVRRRILSFFFHSHFSFPLIVTLSLSFPYSLFTPLINHTPPFLHIRLELTFFHPVSKSLQSSISFSFILISSMLQNSISSRHSLLFLTPLPTVSFISFHPLSVYLFILICPLPLFSFFFFFFLPLPSSTLFFYLPLSPFSLSFLSLFPFCSLISYLP